MIYKMINYNKITIIPKIENTKKKVISKIVLVYVNKILNVKQI